MSNFSDISQLSRLSSCPGLTKGLVRRPQLPRQGEPAVRLGNAFHARLHLGAQRLVGGVGGLSRRLGFGEIEPPDLGLARPSGYWTEAKVCYWRILTGRCGRGSLRREGGRDAERARE